MIKTLTLAFFFLLPAARGGASDAAFLKIDPSARSAALGSASVGLAGDAWSLFSNPAGLAAGPGRRALLTQAHWLDGASYQAAGAVFPGNKISLGAGILHLSHGEMDGRDAFRRPTGSFSAEDQGGLLSLAAGRGPLKSGASLKFLRERIGPFSSAGWAADVGVLLTPRSAPLSWGAALRNLRAQESSGSLSIGAGWESPVGLFALDFHRPLRGNDAEVRLGIERRLLGGLALRGGYAPALSRRADPASWRAGIGFKRGPFHIDYALVPLASLGTTQRMSISYGF